MNFKNAKWIWHNDYRGVNVYVNFEDSFTVDTVPADCKLLLSCDTNYSLTVNGRFVDAGQYADYEDLKFYDVLPLEKVVKPGKNTFCVTVYYQGESSSVYKKGDPGLIFEVVSGEEVLCASGEKTVAYKNTAFADGADVGKVSSQLGYSFRYDANKEGERENERPADLVEKTMTLYERPIDKLVITPKEPAKLINQGSFIQPVGEEEPALRMQNAYIKTDYLCGGIALPSEEGVVLSCKDAGEGRGIFALVDLGRESTGILSLDFEVPAACTVDISWGEHLADLHVRAWIAKRCFAASYQAKAGRNTFENPLRRCGARYVELHIHAPEATLYYAGMRETLYPLKTPKAFRCADHTHNRIYDVSLRTLWLCMHEHYEDCPWREQALYAMDSRNQMLCGYYAFDETRFARSSIQTIAHSICEDHLISLTSPSDNHYSVPSFSAMFLTQLYEYLEFSGDEEFVRQVLPSAEEVAGEFLHRMNTEGGLVKNFAPIRYWNFYEWRPGLDGPIGTELTEEQRTWDATLNAFVSAGMRSMAKICARLGDTEKSAAYQKAHEQLNRLCNERFYNEETGVYATFLNQKGEKYHYCELANALLVYAGAVPEDRLDGVLEALAEDKLIAVSLSHSIFKYDALMQKPEKYGRYVFDTIAKIWGSMLEREATTFWETIEGEYAFDNAGSLCHGWSAIPVYIYFKYGLTLDAKTTGLYEARIDPDAVVEM